MECTPENIEEIKKLPFVSNVEIMEGELIISETLSQELHPGEMKLLKAQVNSLGIERLHQEGLTGQGIRICIIDAGFPMVDQSPRFKHIRDDNRIIKTWDFKKDKEFVYDYNQHGTTVLSCIAGIENGQHVGLAPDAEFLLARTERPLYEGIGEEEDWLMAIEWADKNGADIVNSSLGYTTSMYFKEDMNGQKSLITRAGNMAARKGLLVVNAAGNDGEGYWKYVGAPADADSVLTVGGTNPWTGIHTSFSSYGPTADKRRKPNVSAFGHVMADGKHGMHETQGTSFASPLVAGFAACVLQSDTSLKCMELFEKIESCGRLYPYFDYAHGYGIPSAKRLFEATPGEQTFEIKESEDEISIVIADEHFEKNYIIHSNYYPYKSDFTSKLKSAHLGNRYSSNDSDIPVDPQYFYYEFIDKNGVLVEYYTINVKHKNLLSIPKNGHSGTTLEMLLQKLHT